MGSSSTSTSTAFAKAQALPETAEPVPMAVAVEVAEIPAEESNTSEDVPDDAATADETPTKPKKKRGFFGKGG